MPTRNYRQLDDLPPSWLAECPSTTTNQHTASHPTPAETDSSTFSPTQDILTANQAFSTHSAHRQSQDFKRHLRPQRSPDQEPAEGPDLHPERPEVLQQVKPSIHDKNTSQRKSRVDMFGMSTRLFDFIPIARMVLVMLKE